MSLAVSTAGDFSLLPSLSLSTTFPCPATISIDGSQMEEGSTVSGPTELYPSSALIFGEQCTSSRDPVVRFQDFLNIPDEGLLADVIESEFGDVFTSITTLASVVLMQYLRRLECGQFFATPLDSVGVLYQGEPGFIIRNTDLSDSSARYLHLLSLDSSDDVSSICSYSDTPLEGTSNGAPAFNGDYTDGRESQQCVDLIQIDNNAAVTYDEGLTWVIASDNIATDETPCGSGGFMTFIRYNDLDSSPELEFMLDAVISAEGGSSFGRQLETMEEAFGASLWTWFLSGSMDCFNPSEGVFLGVWVIPDEDTSAGLIPFREGWKYLLSARLSSGRLDTLCVHTDNSGSGGGGGGGGGGGSGSATPTPTPTSAGPSPSPESSGSPSPASSGSPTATTSGPSPTATTGGSSPTPTTSESSPTPTPAPTAAPCFPAAAVVSLGDGSTKQMSELEVGDCVRIDDDSCSVVFFFGHRNPEAVEMYVRLTTETGREMRVSGGHYIYSDKNQLVAASSVRVGDRLLLADGAPDAVVSVSEEPVPGQFAPHTMAGRMVVDGVQVSCYTQVVHPYVARALIAPLKLAYLLGAPTIRFLEETSRAALARSLRLPAGPKALKFV